jgi:hypothetical protein
MVLIDLFILDSFQKFKTTLYNELDKDITKPIIIEGDYCSGKTTIVKKLIQDKYTLIYYNCIEHKGKYIVKQLSKSIAKYDIMTMFVNKASRSKNIIVIDDVDVLNHYDKGGISSLNKFIKNTYKQNIPIVFITSPILEDKRLYELSTLSISIKYPCLCEDDIVKLIKLQIQDRRHIVYDSIFDLTNCNLTLFLNWVHNYNKNHKYSIEQNNYHMENYKQSTRELCSCLLKDRPTIEQHENVIHSKERVTLSMVLHENLRGSLEQHIQHMKVLCDADTIDYIIFKIQNWNFQIYSSLLKNMYSIYIFKDNPHVSNIIFTKILTKYSTQYNNMLYINNIQHKYMLLRDELVDHNMLESRIENKKELNRIIKIIQ